jgi:hypothetical protein
LNALLSHHETKEIFYFDKHKEVPIVFVDVNGYFNGCDIRAYYGRKIIFSHDSSYYKIANYSNIIIDKLVQIQGGYKISVYYKIRNAYFWVEFKRKNNRFIVSKLSGGYS